MDNTRYQEDESKAKKDFGKKKDGKKDKKDKGYIMFEEENSEEEVLVSKENRTPMKLKKHSKPSFKFAKKPKEKEKDKDDKKKDEKEKKKEEKLKSKKKKLGGLGSIPSIPAADEYPVFGVSLAVAIQRNRCHDGIPLPIIFRECLDYIEEYGLTSEGIYRISGVKSKVQALKEAYNKGITVYLKEYEPSVVASLLKQFLRELPEPVLTTELMPKFEQASTIKNVKQKVEEFQHLIERLPTANRTLLSWTIVHMTRVIARERQNKMSLQNVSIVLSPTMQISHRVLNVLFTYSKILFRDTVIKKYVPPLKPVTSRWSLDLPDSPNSLEEELRKQESLLDELHKELMKVKDTHKEEQLWEVQRVVTGLKRKLKFMKKSQEGTPGRSPKFSKGLASSQGIDLKLKQKLEASKQKKEAPEKETSVKQTEEESINKGVSDKVKSVVSPSKGTLDFGDIEVDSSAQSQRQQRKDSQIVERSEVEAIASNKETTTTEKVAQKDEPEKDEIGKEQKLSSSEAISNEDIDDNNQTPDKSDSEMTENKTADNKTEVDTGNSGAEKDIEVITDDSNDKAKSEKAVETVEKDDDVEIKKDEGETSQEILKQEDSNVHVAEKPVTEESDKDKVTINEDKKTDNEGTDFQKDKIGNVPDVTVQSKPEDTQLEQDEEYTTRTVNVVIEEPDDDEEEGDLKEDADNEGQLNVIPPPSNSAREGVDAIQGVRGQISGHTYTGSGIEPEKLAAALSELVHETEEDINQRVMSELLQDFGIEKYESIEEDEEYMKLLREHQALLLEEEELTVIGDELHQKIETEQSEIERLREEIMEIQVMREDIYSSENSSIDSSSSDDESLDGEDLEKLLTDVTRENHTLETKNRDLCDKIHLERQICLEVKVQIRMLQQKQLESSMSNQLDLLL